MRRKFVPLSQHTVTPHILLPAFSGATDPLGTRPCVGTELLYVPMSWYPSCISGNTQIQTNYLPDGMSFLDVKASDIFR